MAHESDNLELLLDTMCNAFGGVMFIAMLLAVLSQFTIEGPPTDAAEQAERQKALEARRLELKARLRKAVAETGRQQDRIRRLADDSPDLLGVLEKLKRENAAMDRTLEDVIRRLLAARAEADRARREELGLTEGIKKLEAMILDLTTELSRLESKPRREWKPARVQATNKASFNIIIKWGELFSMRTPLPGKPRGALDRSVLQMTPDGMAPIQGKGVVIMQDGWGNSPMVRNILDRVPAAQWSLQFAVYPDSYAAFLKAYEFFKSKGYDTNWYVVPGQDVLLKLERGQPTVQR